MPITDRGHLSAKRTLSRHKRQEKGNDGANYEVAQWGSPPPQIVWHSFMKIGHHPFTLNHADNLNSGAFRYRNRAAPRVRSPSTLINDHHCIERS